MATSEEVNESFDDLLTCTICLESFKTPKYLPCLHTFCQLCLHTYITSAVTEETSREFKCPVCRQLVSFETGNQQTWAGQLPGNHFIQSMIDRKAIRNAEKRCSACERKNNTEIAVTWCTYCGEAYCKSCTDNHISFKISANHKLLPLKDVKENSPSDCNLVIVACDEHPDKTIEIYCKDHSKPCCTVCATVNHRKCEHVVTIDKAVSGIKQSKKAQELRNKLAETSGRLHDILQSRKQNIKNFEAETENARRELQQLRLNFNKHIDELEQKHDSELLSTKKQVVIKLDDETNQLSSMKSTVDNWKNLVDASLAQGSELQCLVNVEEILVKIPAVEQELSNLARGMKNTSLTFKPNDVISMIPSLGQVDVKGSYSTGLGKFNFHSGDIKVLFSIDVYNGGGESVSAMFFDSNILVTDMSHCRIAKYSDTGVLKAELKIDKKPTDITKVNDKTVAVATDSDTVFIINEKSFTVETKLALCGMAYGICFIGEEYVTARMGTVSWFNAKTGTLVKSFNTGVDTYFISCSNKDSYVYKGTADSVKYVSADGKGFTYQDANLRDPYHQCTDCDGNIYTTGYYSKDIHQLTQNGQLVRIIPTANIDNTITDHPWVLRFKENNNRFLLTFFYTGKVLICEID